MKVTRQSDLNQVDLSELKPGDVFTFGREVDLCILIQRKCGEHSAVNLNNGAEYEASISELKEVYPKVRKIRGEFVECDHSVKVVLDA